ncbi:MAG TPA: MazG family protein [Candidatus Dormibacteraeota bacterium]|jgi:XTP/dITP diphosphohydrolase|nr:MazG family protein [Candidatus Dormibacteraeota bacterium]
MRDDAAASLRALNEVVERLRAPGGCPWDGVQTHQSLRPYLLEETYEVLEAIDDDGRPTLREELGDVLLQVLMHCAIAAEADDGFDIGDVAETTRAKMIHRHPHVFGDTAVGNAAEVVVNWERLKRSEKGDRLSLLDGIPSALPALAFAQGVQKRPARLGFDETPATSDAVVALRAALDGLASVAGAAAADPVRGQDWTVTEGEIRREDRAAVGVDPQPAAAPPTASLDEAVGELLFTAVALARRLRVNPEDALRARSNRFAERFRSLERQAAIDGADLHDIDAAEWRRRWEDTAPSTV